METKIKEIMSAVFGMEVNEVNKAISPDTIDNWDSLRHMSLVVALEEEFDIEFDDDQISDMLSFEKISEFIKQNSA